MDAIKKVAKSGLFSALIAAAAVIGHSTSAKDITLAWNPNTENDLAGYNLYVAQAGQAPNKLTVGTNIAAVTGLVEGRTYVFYATAFNTAGLESDPSQSISYTVPVSGIQKQMDLPIKVATGGMQITSRGVIGQNYAIQATSNLSNNTQWTTLQVVQPDVTGTIRITDTAAFSRRFYRTIEAP